MRYSEQEAKIRRDAMRDEEFELLYGDGTRGSTTGIKPFFPWNKNANRRDNITFYNKNIKANEFDDIPLEEDKPSWLAEFKRGYNSRMAEDGMLTGAWDKAKEIGGEWWKNISSDKGAYRQEFEDTWLKRLGYSGMPRLEMYIGESAEADFDRDWREYWDTHPDNLSIY